MSAQNKSICPRCHLIDKQNFKRLIDATKSLDIIGYSHNERNYRQPSLSESYEVHTNEFGILFIHYTCHCSECGFEYDFSHTERII